MVFNLKSAVLAITLLCSGFAGAQLQPLKIDPAHSAAQFSVRHMGISTVRGTFNKISGTVMYDPNDPTKGSIDATIEAASVDTRFDMRDKDLRSPNFFDADKYPTLTFRSTRIEVASPGKLRVTGDLTMHGVTKQVVLDVDGPTPPVKDPQGMTHMGASATTTVNRRDFGINGAPSMVGDDVLLTIDTELVGGGPR